jgi:hypothetical protein
MNKLQRDRRKFIERWALKVIRLGEHPDPIFAQQFVNNLINAWESQRPGALVTGPKGGWPKTVVDHSGPPGPVLIPDKE